MNNDVNEMYLEVKKWNTLYPIYFDKSKSIAKGQTLSIQGVNYQRKCVLTIQIWRN